MIRHVSRNGGRRIPFWRLLAIGTVAVGAATWASGQGRWAAALAAGGMTLSLASYLQDRRDN